MIPARSWSGVREEDAGSFFISVRRGVSKGERSPTSDGGGPWSFVGSSGASGLESAAPMAPSPPTNPARSFLRFFETSPMKRNLSTAAGFVVIRRGIERKVAKVQRRKGDPDCISLSPPVFPSPLLISSLRLGVLCDFAFLFLTQDGRRGVLAARSFRLQIDVEERRLADAGDVARLRHGEIDAVDQKARRALVPVRSRFVF